MPDMIPVGNTIIPPDPMRGVNTLSGIIGIQQQRQNLQTGQYIQQSAAAKAQQEGLAAQQAQGVQNFFKTWDPSQHVGNDGTTDVDSALQSQEYQNAGNAKPAVMQALLDIKNKQLTNKTALAGLNNALVTQLGQQAGALAKDSDVIADKTDPNTGVNAGRAKVREMFANYGAQSPDAARIAAIYGGPNVDRVPQGKLSAGIAALQMQARDVGGQQTAQYPGAVTNAAGNILNRTPSTGALSAPPTAGAAAPSAVLPSGPVAPRPPGLGLNPSTPQVASATAAGVGQVGTDNQVFSKVMASGANAQRGIELAQKIQQEAAQVRTGQYSQEFAKKLTILKQQDPTATATQLLQKDAQNLKTLAEEGASTDAERDQIGGGFPSPDTMNPAAVEKAARYWQGSFNMAQARSKNAIDHVSQNGSTAGLTLKDQAFMSTSSPGKFAPPEPTKTVSMQEVADYAKKHNLSIDAAKTHVTNNGFQIK